MLIRVFKILINTNFLAAVTPGPSTKEVWVHIVERQHPFRTQVSDETYAAHGDDAVAAFFAEIEKQSVSKS